MLGGAEEASISQTGEVWMDFFPRLAKSIKKKLRQKVLRRKRFLRVL
jgi:hypothetical protein